MEEMFLQFKLTELKHVILTLRQCDEGPWMREYIRHFNTLVDFLNRNGKHHECCELLKFDDPWLFKLFDKASNGGAVHAAL